MPNPEEEFTTYLDLADEVLAKRFPQSGELTMVQIKLKEALMWLALAPKFAETPDESETK